MTLISFSVILLTISLVVRALYKERKREYFTAPRPSIPAVPIQIVCGDCMENEMIPRRTLLNRFGQCETCGGSSFVLASALYSSKRARMLRAVTQPPAKVIPFKVQNSEKISV